MTAGRVESVIAAVERYDAELASGMSADSGCRPTPSIIGRSTP